MRVRFRRILGKNATLLGIGGLLPTNCFNPLIQLTDGGYGYDTAQTPSGTIEPTYTTDGTFIYSVRFYSTGEFIYQFGIAGDQQLFQDEAETLPVTLIIIKGKRENVEISWNETNLRYEGFNVDMATNAIELVGEEVCFAVVVIPRIIVWYDLATLEVEVEDVVA